VDELYIMKNETIKEKQMGCYDIVKVPCPTCGVSSEFQSKGGECRLNVYTMGYAPNDVMSDVNRHAPCTCDNCGTRFEVKAIYEVVAWQSVVADDEDFEAYRE